MKKFLLGSAILSVLLIACNKSNDATPSNNQKVLGMVVQVSSATASNLILLKDGRAINPQSGFTPARVSAGSKFVLSFQPVSTTGKVLNVNVTSFAAANDSTFTPPPPTGADTVAFITAMQGSHNCTFTSAVVDYSHPADTTKVIRSFTLNVSGHQFESSASYAPVPGGNGIFFFSGNQINNLKFVNTAQLPSNAPPGFLLSGQYYYAVFDKQIAIWTYTNATYSGFLINR